MGFVYVVQLRELQADGIIRRWCMPALPPRVGGMRYLMQVYPSQATMSILRRVVMHKVAVEAGVIFSCSTQQAPVFEA